MSLAEILKRTEKVLVDNSPSILTGIAVAGTVTTAILTARSTLKADRYLREEMAGWEVEVMEPRQKIQLLWKFYIPPALSCGLTVFAIIGANQIGNRRAAAMAAAYSISEKAFEEYKAKVVDKLGEGKERSIRDEIMQDRISDDPPCTRDVIITDREVLCYDAYSDRYFESDMETIKKAQNDINYVILHDYYASLSDFYERLGITRTQYSDEIGWNLDRLLEIEFTTALTEDQRPCICINFKVQPIRGYHRLS